MTTPLFSAARSFSRGDATLVWDACGPPFATRVIVLVHGLGLGRAEYDGLAPLLARNTRVIRVDLPGFGAAPAPSRACTIEDFARLVLALLEALGVRDAVWIGHSMGTQVAVAASTLQPSLVRALVLIAPVVDPAARSRWALFVRMARDLYNESLKVMLTGLWLYARAGIPLFLRTLSVMLAYRTELALAQITAPVLIVRGERDVVLPRAWCVDAAALVPNARLVEIAGVGHETFVNDPGPTAEVTRAFLREL